MAKELTKCVLLQTSDAGCDALHAVTRQHHIAWCEKHSVSNIYVPHTKLDIMGRSPLWYKIAALNLVLEELPEDACVLYMDMDCMCVKPTVSPRAVFVAPADLALVSMSDGTFNTGVIVVRNTPKTRTFFKRVWSEGPMLEPPRILNPDSIGIRKQVMQARYKFLPGGTVSVPLLDGLLEDEARVNFVLQNNPGLDFELISSRWNSLCGSYYHPDPVIVGYHGVEDRFVIPQMLEWLKRLGEPLPALSCCAAKGT